MESTKIVLFKGKQIRKTIFENEWWFSVVDVVAVLTDSANPRDYWYKMKIRVRDQDGVEYSRKGPGRSRVVDILSTTEIRIFRS